MADDEVPGDEYANDVQDAIVAPAGDQLGKMVKFGSEPINDAEQLVDLEVPRRWFSVRASFCGKLIVEIAEEGSSDTDDSTAVVQVVSVGSEEASDSVTSD